jgi:hypothetical protein
MSAEITMTDPYADPSDASAGDQTIPLVPDDGFAEVTQRPFAEETLIDPLANDPWASGPGLGLTSPTPPAPTPPPAPPAPAPSAPTPPPPAAPAAWPQAGTDSQSWGFPVPGAYRATSAPEPQPRPVAYPQPAAPANQRPWADPYPEPSGPAASIPGQPYAPSPYAGQQWPAVPEPPREYGYGYGFDTATDHPNAIPVLIMGIIGLVLFSPLAPVAWYLGAKGQREARLDPGRWRSGGMLAVGKVLGIIGTALLALAVVGIFLFILALVAFGA